MQIEWMEQIAGHLERIAVAHERIASALERIATGADVIAVDKVYGHTAEWVDDEARKRTESLKKRFYRWAWEFAASKAKP